MIKSFVFDEACADWRSNKDYCKRYTRDLVIYLSDYLITNGYIYLNQIYEYFGVKWNPKDDNNVILADNINKNFIDVEELPEKENTWIITIHC